MRWITQPTQGTGRGVRTWSCPQCNEALRAVVDHVHRCELGVGSHVGLCKCRCGEVKVLTEKWPITPVRFGVLGTEGLEALVAAAQEAKVVIYDDPRELDYGRLEEEVRAPCRRINESGWCFTAESCHGHVHENDRSGGSWGDEPFLRLTARREHFGHLLYLFSRAMVYQDRLNPAVDYTEERVLSFAVYLDTRGEPAFGSAIIRIPSPRVYSRRLALEAFARFGDLVNQELP